ncbi:MAG: phage holin family protein [Steroidobacteraceae bacterium]
MSEPAASTGADQEPGQEGHALRDLLTTALDAFRTRLDLAAVELELHLLALARMLVWAVAAIVCGLLALAFGVTAMIAVLWDTHRSLGLVVGTVLFIALAVTFGLVGARAYRGQPGILSGSLEQLDEDYKSVGAGQ